MDEICSYQKAAWLGFKAGDPNVTVCWNATTAKPTERQTDAPPPQRNLELLRHLQYPHLRPGPTTTQRLWTPTRRAACGKPLWITESDRGMKSEPSSPTHDLSPRNQRLKAQYVTQSYVQSLHAGSHRHFHFILGQYGEGETQFGLLRHDMTPHPAYVALAALGRLLAGARCLGRLNQLDTPNLHVYAFRARPDGKQRDVLVAWTEKNVDWSDRGKAKCTWQLPEGLTPEHCFDHLGRDISLTDPITLTSAPIFLLLPKDQCNGLSLTRPAEAPRRVDHPSPIILQCAMPQGTAHDIKRIPWASEYEYHIEPGTPCRVPIYAYNFGQQPVRDTIRLQKLPPGCKAEPTEWQIELNPMDRAELRTQITITQDTTPDKDNLWFILRGNLGMPGPPVLAFRLVAK